MQRVHRHDGVQADQQVDALLERHRGVKRLEQHAIDIVPPVDAHRRVEPGQRRRRLDGARDRHVVERRLAEAHGVTRVEVGGDDNQFVGQLAKVVGATLQGVDPLEVGADKAAVVEHARGSACESRVSDSAIDRSWGRRSTAITDSTRRPGMLSATAQPLTDCRFEESLGHERVLTGLGLDDRPGTSAPSTTGWRGRRR